MPPDFETLSPVSETNGPDFETLAPVDATPDPAPAKPENPARRALAEGLKRDRSVGGFLRAETATIAALEGLAQGTARAPATLANLPFQAIGALFPRGHGAFITPDQVKEGYSQVNEALHPAGLPASNPTEAEKGAGDFAAEFISGATTPENVLAMATPAAAAKLAPAISPAINQVVGRLFQGQMLAGIPEGLQRLGEAKGTAAQVKEGLNVAAGALIPAVIEKSFRSGLLPKAAKAADQAAREASGKPQEPADPAKTPTEGETTQGDPATEQDGGVKTPLLSAEDQAYLDTERKAMDTPVEVIPEPTPGADDPFARSRKAGQFMGIDRAKGTVQIYAREFGEWLKSVPEKQRAQAIRSRLAEEQNHLAVTPEQAASYWDTLTAAEQAIETRQYTGQWKGRPDISGTDMGFEAIRRRMQRLAGMPTSEIAESALRERWTLQGLDALSSTIRGVRETLGTSASKEGLAILDRVQGGIDAAKGAVSGQQGNPAAIRRDTLDDVPEGLKSALSMRVDKQFSSPQWRNEALSKGEDVRESQPSLESLTKGRPLFHETSLQSAFGVYQGLRRPFKQSWTQFLASDNPDLAIGQSGKGVLFEISPNRVNGWRHAKPGTTETTGFEYAIDRSVQQSVKSVTFSNKRQMSAFQKRFPNSLDYTKAAETERGLRVPSKFWEPQEHPSNPAAIRRFQKPKDDPSQPGFDLGAVKGAGQLSQPAKQAATEMLGQADAARYQAVTPKLVEETAGKHFEEAARPSFKGFVDDLRAQVGDVQPGQVQEAWTKAVWDKLQTATGAELGSLRDKLGLGRDVGTRQVADAAAGKPTRNARQQGLGLDAKDPTIEVSPELQRAIDRKGSPGSHMSDRTRSEQNYRANVMARIGEKLIAEATEGKRAWQRKEVTPQDVGHWRESSEGAFNAISPQEAANPDTLGRILTEGAGVERSTVRRSVRAGQAVEVRQKAPPETVTKRLTAFLNRATGKVELVSTYRHSRAGAMVVDPTRLGSARPNVPLADVLKRYQPLYSILLDEPVQNFHQGFESVRDFEERFGAETRAESQRQASYDPPLEEGSDPHTGGILDKPLNAENAGSLLDHLYEEVLDLESPEDVQDAIKGVVDTRNFRVAAAYEKIYQAIRKEEPGLSPEAAADKLAQQVYELAKNSPNREGFIQSALAKYAKEAPRDVQGPAEAPEGTGAAASPTAKDLTLPRFARKGVPFGQSEATPPRPGAGDPSLSPADQARVTEAAARKTPYKPTEAPADNPAAIVRKAKEAGEDKFHKVVGQISGMFARHSQKQELSRLVDVADTIRVTTSQEARRAIEQPSSSAKQKHGNPEILRAARAINASYYVPQAGGQPIADRLALPGFRRLTDQGAAKARQLIASPTPATMAALGLGDITGVSRGEILGAARKWLQAATDLGKEVDVAIAKFGQADLMGTTKELRNEFRLQLQRERAAGRTVSEAENYLPGLYEGEIYGDHSVTFGDITLGKSYGKPKTFKNVYEAIDAGPYIPKLNNVADSASVRIRAGMGGILRDAAFKAPLGMADPVSGSPVAIEAELSPKGGYQVPGGNLQYKLVYPEGGGKPLAVRRGYAKLVEDLFGKSGIADWTGGKALMRFGAIEKHTTLAMDLYHLSKMMWYAMAVTRSRTGYRGAHTALEFRPGNMAEAVRRGVISQKDMDWAMQRHTVTLDGSTQALTNQQLLREFQRTGLNVGRVQDAMYKHFVDSLDVQIAGRKLGIGSYNHFLFDQWTRGFMGNTAVMEFLRQHQAAPNIDARVIMKRIAGDINTQFGSVGKQSLVKNATLRDLGQLTFLAAQWTGSRISTEAKFLSRLATTPYVLATEGRGAANVHFGSIGRGVGTGLVTMLALTQAINLFTRRQFTWQNPEEDHKLDAFVPDMAGGPGHWVSPLSVFLEMTHDVSRYMASGRKNLMETINQIGQNKLAPIGRAVGVLASGYTPMGQKITSTSGRFAEAGKALIPAPITISSAAREIGHQAAPGTVSPNPPGALNRQLLSSIGVKSENQASNASQMAGLAKDWMKAQGLEKETGWMQIQTDEPGYTKLRQALRADDKAKATQQIEELRKSRSDAAIKKAMQTWAKRGFTGSKKTESLFLRSLTDQQADVYYRAMDEKQGTLAKFEDFLSSLP